MGSSDCSAASSSKSGRLSFPGRFPAGDSRSPTAIGADGRGQSGHLPGVVGVGIQSGAGCRGPIQMCR